MLIRTQTGATIIINDPDEVTIDLKEGTKGFWDITLLRGPFQYNISRVYGKDSADRVLDKVADAFEKEERTIDLRKIE